MAAIRLGQRLSRIGVLLVELASVTTGSRYAAADGAESTEATEPFTLEAGGGVGPTLIPGSGAIGLGANASVGAGYFVTPWLAATVRSTTGFVTNGLALWRASCSDAGPGGCDRSDAAGVFGFIGPAAELSLGDSAFVGIGFGLSWQYRTDGSGFPYSSGHGFGGDIRLGRKVASLNSGRVVAQLEYFGAPWLATGALAMPGALSLGLGYQWNKHSCRASPDADRSASGSADASARAAETARREARRRAWAYLDDATKLALNGDCAAVKDIGAQIRVIDGEFYETTFIVDPIVTRCFVDEARDRRSPE